MPEPLSTDPQSESERLDVAADQAIEACGGDMRSAIRALILANEFLETQISKGYTRGFKAGVDHGRFKTYSG